MSLFRSSPANTRSPRCIASPLKARQGVERDFGEGDTCVCPSGVYSAEREDRGQSTSGGKLQCAQQPAWGH
ncbi:hypothetical protein GN956_G5876 [Arapaima gigas]